MAWILLALLTALFESIKDLLVKKNLQHVNEYIVALSFRLFSLPVFIIALFFFPYPSFGEQFWLFLFLSGSINVVSSIFFVKSLKYGDLSASIPLLAFTPLFLLITSPIINNEFPSSYGFIGILLIVIGSYTLNIKERHKGFFEPFKALVKKKGPRYMLIVAFIWSITSNFDKIGIENSSPVYFAFAINLFLAIAIFPIAYYKARNHFSQIKTHWKGLFGVGSSAAIRLIFQYTALQLTLVAYVISIKRTSAVLGVLFGFLFLREKGIKEKLLGASLMVLGVLFITLF